MADHNNEHGYDVNARETAMLTNKDGEETPAGAVGQKHRIPHPKPDST
jgi:hypothetical protein